MTDVTLESVKLYATEVKEHWQRYCYFLDILAHLILWRGRANILGRSFWFPIHSVVFFVGISLAVEYPVYLPSLISYLIAYVLLCNNYVLSKHPSPWLRVRSFAHVAFNNHFSTHEPVIVEPETGSNDAKLLQRLDQYRGLRVMAFLYQAIMVALKVYRVYSKNTPVDISTVLKSGSIFSKLYVNYLYYAHLVLRSTSILLLDCCRVMHAYTVLCSRFLSQSGLQVYTTLSKLCELARRKNLQIHHRFDSCCYCVGVFPLQTIHHKFLAEIDRVDYFRSTEQVD